MLRRSESNIIENKTGVSENEGGVSLEIQVSRPGGVNPQVADKNLRRTDLGARILRRSKRGDPAVPGRCCRTRRRSYRAENNCRR